MIPKINEELTSTIERKNIPSRTYKLHRGTEIIAGHCDGIEAVKQAVYKALHTERYDYLIYSWNYGAELKDLFGKQLTYVYAEVKRRIEEALLQDDRILNVKDFTYEKTARDTLHITFTVESTEGNFESEVNVNV